MRIPVREKYVDEAVGVWVVFGTRGDGTVDIGDGHEDVFRGIPESVAEDLCALQAEFRHQLYKALCQRSDI